MKEAKRNLDRLLRSAANAPAEPAPETPFGFDTRVLAAWRAYNGRAGDPAEMTRFLRRIGAVAIAVLTLASAGAYQQFSDAEQKIALQTNEYAIAETAIQTEFSQ